MRPTLAKATLLALLAPAVLTACGSSSTGASGSTAPSTSANASSSAAGGTCTPKSGDSIVVLADDKHSQLSDNVIPIVNTKAVQKPLTDALNAVSAALSQSALTALNSAVSVDKETSAQAAKDWVTTNKVAAGITGGSGTITVGAAGFAESLTLANVYADVLTNAGYSATAKQLGKRDLYEPALEKDEIQVFPEYAATLTTFLATKQKDTTTKASTDITATVAALKPLAAKAGLTALDPAAATDENAFAVSKTTAEAYGLKTLSDVAAKCSGGVTLGAPPECPQQGFCSQALESVYGIKITTLSALDEDGPITRQALKTGKVFLGEIFSSDADAVAAS